MKNQILKNVIEAAPVEKMLGRYLEMNIKTPEGLEKSHYGVADQPTDVIVIADDLYLDYLVELTGPVFKSRVPLIPLNQWYKGKPIVPRSFFALHTEIENLINQRHHEKTNS